MDGADLKPKKVSYETFLGLGKSRVTAEGRAWESAGEVARTLAGRFSADDCLSHRTWQYAWYDRKSKSIQVDRSPRITWDGDNTELVYRYNIARKGGGYPEDPVQWAVDEVERWAPSCRPFRYEDVLQMPEAHRGGCQDPWDEPHELC